MVSFCGVSFFQSQHQKKNKCTLQHTHMLEVESFLERSISVRTQTTSEGAFGSCAYQQLELYWQPLGWSKYRQRICFLSAWFGRYAFKNNFSNEVNKALSSDVAIIAAMVWKKKKKLSNIVMLLNTTCGNKNQNVLSGIRTWQEKSNKIKI